MKSFVFTYSCFNIIANSTSQHTKIISTKDVMTAQVQLLLFLNKCNKVGNGKVQFWCDDIRPSQTLELCDTES